MQPFNLVMFCALMGHIIIETDENQKHQKKITAENMFAAQNINRFSPLLLITLKINRGGIGSCFVLQFCLMFLSSSLSMMFCAINIITAQIINKT